MKKSLLIAVITVIAFVFCGCSSSSPGATGSSGKANATIASASESTASNVDYPLNEYTMEGDVGRGYTYEAQLKIGPWVKASDTESINSIWKSIGGSGQAPDIGSFTYNNYSSGISFSEGTSLMAFGTMSITDTTQGDFSLADTSNQFFVSIHSQELTSALLVDSCVSYSGKNSFLHSIESGRIGSEILRVTPQMKKKNWGPVPFVICCSEALSPEYPDGKPEAMNATWAFGDNKFTVSPMWAS